MAQIGRTWHQPVPEEHKTTAEDTAVILALFTIVVLSALLVAVLLLEFLEILPTRASGIVLLTIVAFSATIGRAILVRAFSLPSHHKGGTPLMRSFHRKPPRRRPSQQARRK